MTKEEKIIILNKNIEGIENQKIIFDFVDGGYSYSKELTSIFKILDDEEYKIIYKDNVKKYDSKDLEKNVNPETYSLIECIIYFNWIWHVDGSGLATGIVARRIKEGKYLKALKRFKTIIENS